MSIINDGLFNVSGGSANRQVAEFLCHIGNSVSAFPAFDAMRWSGPIDAPVQIPAGSCNSTYARNGRGEYLPSVSVVAR